MDDHSVAAHLSSASDASCGPTPSLIWQLCGLSPAPASVVAARRQAHDALAAWNRGRRLPEDDALLLLDELAANAVRHAHTPFTVTLRLDDDGLRGAVLDHDPRPPVPRTPTLEDLGGRGFQMVAALADRWGVDRHGGRGKTVWFEIDVGL